MNANAIKAGQAVQVFTGYGWSEAHVRKIEADTEGHVFDVFVSFYYEDRREWVSPLNVREFNGTLGYGD